MAWVESASASFSCRHSSAQTADAARVLASLEAARTRLAEWFPRSVDGLTVVLHDSEPSLTAANPLFPAWRRAVHPAARRYVTGWVTRSELHLLASAGDPAAINPPALAATTLYARRLVIESNHDLHRALAPARTAVAVRWAWLLEGSSRWFSGEVGRVRPAIVWRLREGRQPAFPPGFRDAPLLAGTVFDLLVREEGERAAAALAGRLHPGGSQGALVKAFSGRPLVHTEGAWRSYLARIAYAA